MQFLPFVRGDHRGIFREDINMKIAFIGGGNMGEAILAAMLGKKLAISQRHHRQRYQ